VLELLLGLNRREQTTLVLVTHDAQLAGHADRRITLRDGRIVDDVTNSG
jgi:putative ABC transport system ATP-binding protein